MYRMPCQWLTACPGWSCVGGRAQLLAGEAAVLRAGRALLDTSYPWDSQCTSACRSGRICRWGRLRSNQVKPKGSTVRNNSRLSLLQSLVNVPRSQACCSSSAASGTPSHRHSQHSPVAVSTRRSSAHCWQRRPPAVESWMHAPAMQPSGLQGIIHSGRGGSSQVSAGNAQLGAVLNFAVQCCCAKLTRTGSAAGFVRVLLLQHLRMTEAMRPQQWPWLHRTCCITQPTWSNQGAAAHLSTAGVWRQCMVLKATKPLS